MKIRIDKDIVEMIPENAAEKAELEALWIKMGNCLGGNKSLEPIGVYIPNENKTVSIGMYGNCDFFSLKGICENVLKVAAKMVKIKNLCLLIFQV